MGNHENDRVWLYCPTCTKGKSPRLRSLWEGPHKVVTQVSEMVYRIQRNPKCLYAWNDWHLIRELLGMSSLKEGAVVAV
jgi:hypothetical protein